MTQPREQRARLGSELRQLRMLAGLSGEALGRHLGISQKTVSRIEHGESLPSMDQVTAWAAATRVPADRLAVLTGLLESAVNEVVTFRDKLASGITAVQAGVRDLEAVSGTVRNFQPGYVPGLLQTAAYARAVLRIGGARDDDDLASAVTVRLDRQQALHDGKRTFEFVMTEAALRWRPGPELMTAQLGHIASVATLDAVELSVIPADAEMGALVRCGFILYEDRTDEQPPVVSVETPAAELTASDPREVDVYREQLALFRRAALHGAEALDFLRQLAHGNR